VHQRSSQQSPEAVPLMKLSTTPRQCPFMEFSTNPLSLSHQTRSVRIHTLQVSDA
jgi:hypothetical protein